MTINDMITQICNEFSTCADGCPLKICDGDYLCQRCNYTEEPVKSQIEKAYMILFNPIDEDELMNIFAGD